jgi:hypothetical protein
MVRERPAFVIAIVAGTVGVLVGAGVVLGTVMATAPRRGPEAASLPPPSASPPAPPPNPDEKRPTTRLNVLVTAEPVDATIAIDDGSSDAPQLQPRTFSINGDEKVSLRVERSGYRSVRLVLDPATAQPRLQVILERDSNKKAVAEPRKETAVEPAPAQATGGGFTRRPASCPLEDWDMFTHTCRPR